MDKMQIAPWPSIALQQLYFAIAAADCGSFRQAADILSVKHSVMSRSIRRFEHTINIDIFERSCGGVKPTSAGRCVLNMARAILEQVDTLVTTAQSLGGGEAGRIAVGFCTSISAGNLRATLVDHRNRFPEVELKTVERSRMRLEAMLHNGMVDILILAGEAPVLDHRVLPLWSERILVAMQNDHDLAVRDAVFWTDLRNETVLLSNYDPGPDLESTLMSKLISLDGRPRIERHDVSRGTIKGLIDMRQGVGLMLESDLGVDLSGLTYRELRDGAGPSRLEFMALWRPDNENPALRSFLSLLAERYPLPSACEVGSVID
jgi:DNA-binding transcriptional LysR family regulator